MTTDSFGIEDEAAPGQALRISVILLTLAAPFLGPVILRAVIRGVIKRVAR